MTRTDDAPPDLQPAPGWTRETRSNRRVDRWLSLILFAVFAGMTAAAWNYPPVARTFPLLVGLAGSALSGVLVMRHVVRADTPGGDASGAPVRPRLAVLLWFGTAIGLVVLGGILAGTPTFIVLFLTVRERQPFWRSTAAAISVPLVLYGVIERTLGLYLFRGVLWP